MSQKNTCLLVTTSSENHGYEKTRIWNPKRPLQIAHPAQATLHLENDNFIITDETGNSHKFTKKDLLGPSPFQIRLKNQVKLKIQPSYTMPAPLENPDEIKQNMGSTVLQLHVHLKIEHFGLGLEKIASSYTGNTRAGKVFSLKKKSKDYVLKSHKEGLVVHLNSKKPETLSEGKSISIPEGEISLMNLVWNKYSWEFAWLNPPSKIQPEAWVEEDTESKFYQKGLAVASSLYVVLGLWVWFSPKHDLAPVGGIPPEKIVASTEINIQDDSLGGSKMGKSNGVTLPSRFFDDYKARGNGRSAESAAVANPGVQQPSLPQGSVTQTSPQAGSGQGDSTNVTPSAMPAQSQPSATAKSSHGVKGPKIQGIGTGAGTQFGHPQGQGGSLSKAEKSALALKNKSKALQDALGGIVDIMKSGNSRGKSSGNFAQGKSNGGSASGLFGSGSGAGSGISVRKTEIQANFPGRGGFGGPGGTGGGTGIDSEGSGNGLGRQYASDEIQQRVLKGATSGKKMTFALDNSAGANGVGLSSSGLTKQEVSGVIRSHLSDVRYCYEAASRIRSLQDGKVVLKFTVIASGLVKQAEIEESTIGDNRLEQCLVAQIKSWKFNKPKNGVQVDISYPFVFHNLASGD